MSVGLGVHLLAGPPAQGRVRLLSGYGPQTLQQEVGEPPPTLAQLPCPRAWWAEASSRAGPSCGVTGRPPELSSTSTFPGWARGFIIEGFCAYRCFFYF